MSSENISEELTISDTQNVVLSCNDGKVFKAQYGAIKLSKTIKDVMETLGVSNEPIPLPNVNSRELELVIEYCEHHQKVDPKFTNEEKAEQTTEKDKYTTHLISKLGEEWVKKFFNNLPQDKLFDLLLAANFLDIDPIIQIIAYSIAQSIKGKTPEEIKSLYNITGDFTKEEEEKALKDNPWLGENPVQSEDS